VRGGSDRLIVADRLDVAERLAEGRPAVEDTQRYVLACQALGYTHPDLTAHPTQVLDLYLSEDGMDLRALDRDCERLRAAASALTEAVRIQRAQLAALAEAWTGPGGDAAMRLLERHCDAGATVVTEVGAAAQRCESLRDNLWYLVDSKVATAIAVDERARRDVWLAAVAAVTTGSGDRAGAENMVRTEIAPYVDEDIRNGWLTTMRSTRAGVTASYDMVIDRMAAEPAPTFELPGVLRPGAQPPGAVSAPVWIGGITPAAEPAAAADPVFTQAAPGDDPAMALAPDPVAAPAAASAPVVAPDPAPAGAVPGQAEPGWGTGLADMAGGPGGVGGLSGLAGLADRIVDAMGTDAFDDPPDDPQALDDTDDSDDGDDSDGSDDGDDSDDGDGSDDNTQDGPATEAQPAHAPPGQDESPPSAVAHDGPPPSEAAAPTAAAPAGGAEPAGKEESTPCEIAADQLPQAGQ